MQEMEGGLKRVVKIKGPGGEGGFKEVCGIEVERRLII